MLLKAVVAVDVWNARIPGLGRFAEHHWFVVCRPSQTDRWEVWQHLDQGGDSWGHLHRNLLKPSSGVGNGPGRLLRRWVGADAVAIAERIELSPDFYRWRLTYRIFPGTNSNTCCKMTTLLAGEASVVNFPDAARRNAPASCEV